MLHKLKKWEYGEGESEREKESGKYSVIKRKCVCVYVHYEITDYFPEMVLAFYHAFLLQLQLILTT